MAPDGDICYALLSSLPPTLGATDSCLHRGCFISCVRIRRAARLLSRCNHNRNTDRQTGKKTASIHTNLLQVNTSFSPAVGSKCC